MRELFQYLETRNGLSFSYCESFFAPDEEKRYENLTIEKFIRLIHPDKPSDYVVQQFTGLLDKKDTEVYEGDIVLSRNNKQPLEVLFCKGGWILLSGSSQEDLYSGVSTDFFDMKYSLRKNSLEVIGNICETPNLLRPYA